MVVANQLNGETVLHKTNSNYEYQHKRVLISQRVDNLLGVAWDPNRKAKHRAVVDRKLLQPSSPPSLLPHTPTTYTHTYYTSFIRTHGVRKVIRDGLSHGVRFFVCRARHFPGEHHIECEATKRSITDCFIYATTNDRKASFATKFHKFSWITIHPTPPFSLEFFIQYTHRNIYLSVIKI